MMKRTWFMLLTATIATGLLIFAGCPNGTGASNPPPVGCDNIFGYNTDDDDFSFTNGAIIAVSFNVAESQDINMLASKFGTATGKCGMGLYSDNSGEPGTLLAETAILTTIVGWQSASIPKTSLSAGVTYWLVTIGDYDGPRFKSTGPGVKYLAYTTFNPSTLPINPTGWTDSADKDVKVYATLVCP